MLTLAQRPALLLAALVLRPMSAEATIVFDGGSQLLTNTVINDNIDVQNGATLNLGHGAVVDGPPRPPGALALGMVDLSSSFSATSTLRLADNATIVGGVSMRGPGVLDASGTSRIGGGISVPYGIGNTYSTISLRDRAVVDGSVVAGNNITIADDAVVNGLLRNNGNISLNMTGGLVTGGAAFTHGVDYVDVRLTGGTIQDRLHIGSIITNVGIEVDGGRLAGDFTTQSSTTFTMGSGRVDGGITAAQGSLRLDVHDGSIGGGVTVDYWAGCLCNPTSAQISYFGGSLDASSPTDWLMSVTPGSTTTTSTIDIFGGEFGFAELGRGIFVDYLVNLYFYGESLTFANGRVTGFLESGSWIDTPIAFGDNWSGEVRVGIPEPGTLALLGTGLIPLLWRRRRAQA